MAFGALTRDNAASGVDPSALVAVDVRGLDAVGLDSRLRELGRVQSRVSGLIAEVVAEKKRRSRVGDTVDGLLEGLRVSKGQARTASFTEQDDGMWRLYALFDPTAAARIRKAFNAKTDAKWRLDNKRGRDHISDRHRRADALEQLITRQNTEGGQGQPQGTTLLLMANYDLVDNKLGNPRLADGTPLPASEFHKLACDADILCGLFREADSEPIWLGSTSRHPNFALRAALEARDEGCIGCRIEPEWCISHHIIEWQHGGPTQPDNLVLLCHSCHDKVHHNNWAVEKHPDTGRRYLRPPGQKPPPRGKPRIGKQNE